MREHEEKSLCSCGKHSVLYITGSEKQKEVKLSEGTWEVLADGEDSFLWKHPQIAAKRMKVSPVSILILGKREESR